MPLITESSYRSPWWCPGGHLQTIVPALARRAHAVTDEDERLELADGDFLDLCWKRGRPSSRLAIVCHGLEAGAEASYIQEMAGALADAGWEVLAWSYRGCSREPNRTPGFYHSGATHDLAEVIAHASSQRPDASIDLIGFSLGGNLILKFLGERGSKVPTCIGRAVAFSVPCDLACSARALDTPFNREVYMRRFITTLREKIRTKHELFPDDVRLSPEGLEKIRTFREFDTRYTAPLHGFEDAEDYWSRSSSRQFLAAIRVPALLVNADNDPFLGPACYPVSVARESDHFHLEITRGGGHVGFPGKVNGRSWMTERALRFLAPEQ
ncbi:MAG: alpha/beta fold hydrolase [Verrucomicrobiota bacterium JB023]|nr:alpha/beta fold hydrolase [Verrucomicrobiota bacterium JB023]